jgi:hypothetical protein
MQTRTLLILTVTALVALAALVFGWFYAGSSGKSYPTADPSTSQAPPATGHQRRSPYNWRGNRRQVVPPRGAIPSINTVPLKRQRSATT